MSVHENLETHFRKMCQFRVDSEFASNPARTDNFSLEFEKLLIDFSRHRITEETISLLTDMAGHIGLKDRIDDLFNGEMINKSEKRQALHTALRYSGNKKKLTSIFKQIENDFERVSVFIKDLHASKIVGWTNKPIDTIVHIGIGGSDLGTRLTVSALRHYKISTIVTHFVSNLDPQDIETVLEIINPETCLFVVCSKSFSTEETIGNSQIARQWLIEKGCSDLSRHFIAITSRPDKAATSGIIPDNIFNMHDWTGGRYSIWSAAGLTLAANTGMKNFELFLQGARKMDEHFFNEPFTKNIPILLGLIDIWYINYFKTKSMAVVPYDDSLAFLPGYLSQLMMESNGKSVTMDGEEISTETAPVIWGDVGTNSQHAFMQQLHQGTQMIPVEFLVPVNSHSNNKEQHKRLFANCLAQARTLLNGTDDDSLPSWRRIKGNKPSTVIVYEKMTPEVLGMLLAMYEHRTFVQATIWNINPFDQWGVEQGKVAAGNVLASLDGNKSSADLDPATEKLVDYFREKTR